MVGAVAKVPDKETQGDKQPEAAPPVASNRVPVIAVSLAALAVIGAATANSLPNFGGFAWPDFNQFSLPKADRLSLPDFSRFSLPNFKRVAAQPVPKPAPAPLPDPIVRAALRDIQLSQQQNTTTLASLTQNATTQQADLKKITRQLTLLSAQVDSLQNPSTPLTTSSIPQPMSTAGIPPPNPRTRVVRLARKGPPPLPKPFGPVSVGGAPLSPAPAPGSGTS
jgi:hypothetical protein